MRLINATTLRIQEFLSDDSIPPFAILSHTWGKDEVTLQQMTDPTVSSRTGYAKIKICCEQALVDGLQWAWVDTCCIDKTSTAELSEAINSMFRWYRDAKVCYAFLSDVFVTTELAQSRWFTRGWTLQELVAPANVLFYNADWQYLGSKFDLREILHHITSIEEEVLIGSELSLVSVARRMSWAANRQTTRAEDLAYCLIGIFNVNMPLLYGEGRKAFTRLQEEILKVSDDHSLFAWGLPPIVRTMQEYLDSFSQPTFEELHGLFADSPSDFTFSNRIHPLEHRPSTLPPIVSNSGVRIELQVKQPSLKAIQFAVISCTTEGKYEYYLGFPILRWGDRSVARCGELLAIAVADLVSSHSATPYREASVLFIKAPSYLPHVRRPTNVLRLAWNPGKYSNCYSLSEVHCSAHATYSSRDQTITLSEEKNALHAAILFSVQEVDWMDIFLDEGIFVGKKVTRMMPKKDSLITSLDSAHTTYKVAHPSFAILIGGSLDDPWTEMVVLLSDDDTDGDFDRLLKTSGDFVRHCSSKKRLLSLLRHNDTVELHRGERLQRQCRQITYWSFTSLLSRQMTQDTRDRRREQNGKGLLVDAEVRMVASNLVERSLFVFIEVKNMVDEGQNVTEKPTWWSLESQV